MSELDDFVNAAHRRHMDFDRQRELARLSVYAPPPPPVEVHQMTLPSAPFRRPKEEDPLPTPTPAIQPLLGYNLYPAPTYDPNSINGTPLSEPAYPPEDLPDRLNIVLPSGTVFEVFTHQPGTYTYNGTITNPGNGVEPELSFGDWHYYVTNPSGDGEGGDFFRDVSLIGTQFSYGDTAETTCSIADLFPSTLSVNGDVITRQSPATWFGRKTGGGTWTLDYGITIPYKWSLNGTAKTAPQNSPAGVYGGYTVA